MSINTVYVEYLLLLLFGLLHVIFPAFLWTSVIYFCINLILKQEGSFSKNLFWLILFFNTKKKYKVKNKSSTLYDIKNAKSQTK